MTTHTQAYQYPSICARCGAPNPTTTGRIIKQDAAQLFRFFWQKTERITLTVPVCPTCQAYLNKHSWRAAVLANMALVLCLIGAFFLRQQGVNMLIAVFFAAWGAPLLSRVCVNLYRRIFYHPQGTTWPQLCEYEDSRLTFTQPEFQQEFFKLNER